MSRLRNRTMALDQTPSEDLAANPAPAPSPEQKPEDMRVSTEPQPKPQSSRFTMTLQGHLKTAQVLEAFLSEIERNLPKFASPPTRAAILREFIETTDEDVSRLLAEFLRKKRQ